MGKINALETIRVAVEAELYHNRILAPVDKILNTNNDQGNDIPTSLSCPIFPILL